MSRGQTTRRLARIWMLCALLAALGPVVLAGAPKVPLSPEERARLTELRTRLLKEDFADREGKRRELAQEAKELQKRAPGGFRAPRPFDSTYEIELAQAQKRHAELEAMPAGERGLFGLAEMLGLKHRIRELLAHKQRWNGWVRKYPEESRRMLRREEFAAVPRLDYKALFKMFKQFRSMDTARRRLPGNEYLTPPTAQQWEALARELESYRRYGLNPREERFKSEVALLLRGRLLLGACYLFASSEHYRAGDRSAAQKDYGLGITALEETVRLGRLGSEKEIGYLNTDLMSAGIFDVPKPTMEEPSITWPDIFGHAGESGGGLMAWSTQRQAETLLSHYCPWGVLVYEFLRDAGITEGLDWNIVPETGSEKLSEATLKAVPAHIAKDTRQIVDGKLTIEGRTVPIDWVLPPKHHTTIWFGSVRLHYLKGAEVIEWGLKSFKLLWAGPIALVADEAKGAAADWATGLVTSNEGVHYATARAADLLDLSFHEMFWLNPTGLKFKAAFGIEDASKAVVKDSIRRLEKLEMEHLLESVNVDNKEVNEFYGSNYTYHGQPVPPVVVRTDVVGFPSVPDTRYGRVLRIVRYWRLHYRLLAGEVLIYDLKEDMPDDLYLDDKCLAGDEDALRVTWQLQPGKWGTTVSVTDFTPRGQFIILSFAQEMLDAWAKGMGKDEALFVELLPPPQEVAAGGPKHLPVYDMDVETGLVERTYELRPSTSRLTTEIDLDTARALLLPVNIRQFDPDKLPVWQTMGSEALCRSQVTDELFTEYVARVVRCARVREGVPADLDAGSEKARFLVRLLPRVGKPLTGERDYPQAGYVRLRQRYEKATKVRTVEPTRGVLLAPKLILRGLSEGDEVTVRAPDYGEKVFGITAYLSPATTGWKRMLVDVGGKSFVLWDNVEGTSAGAIFFGRLPQPAGESNTTVTIVASDGGKRHKFTYKILRPQPDLPGYDEENWKAREEWINENWSEYKDVKLDLAERYVSLARWANAMVGAAEEHIENENYAEARDMLVKVVRALPKDEQLAGLKAQGMEASLSWRKMNACEQLVKAAFYTGDRASMALAAPAWAKHKRQYLQESRDMGYVAPEQFARESDEYLEVLKKCVLLGVDKPHLNEVRSHYRWCVGQTGNFDPKVDITRYLYPAN